MSIAVVEPLLTTPEGRSRFVMFPIRVPVFDDLFEKHLDAFWTHREIDFQADLDDWNLKLSDGDRYFIKRVLAFFAASDGLVMENLSVNFANEIQDPSARAFYAFQGAMEAIHSKTYSLLIDAYIKDPNEQDELFNAIELDPGVKAKAQWAQRWMSQDIDIRERIVAFIAVEGGQFSGSFCAIYWIKKRGLMPGLTFSNELIARDEGLHATFGVEVYKSFVQKLSQERVHQIWKEMIDVEEIFIRESLPVDLIGMSADSMIEYVKFVADFWIKELGYAPIYNARNPFPWMTAIGVQGQTNFFERRVGDYGRSTGMKQARKSMYDKIRSMGQPECKSDK